jgi:hypothetical protein
MEAIDNYKINIGVQFVLGTTRPTLAILDSGASFNIVHEHALPKGWKQSPDVDPNGDTRNLQDASGKVTQNVGTIYLNIHVGQEQKRLRFLVMKNLAVPMILGCEFLDEHVKSIYPKEKRVELQSGQSLPLYTRLIRRLPTPVYVAQNVVLAPYSETNIMVHTDNEGTCYMQEEIKRKHSRQPRYAVASGISSMYPKKPFMLRAANYGPKPILLQKHRIVGRATPLHNTVLTISDINLEKMEQKEPPQEDIAWKDQLDLQHLTEETQSKVTEMLSKFSSMWTGQLGEINITQHRIDLVPDAKPVYQAPYRAGVKGRKVEKEEVERMLKAGVIEPANSEWASPVVLITKPDGSIRFCVDYRKLNALTVKDSYPLPRMDECLDSLGDSTIFTTLDCNSGYWQIVMKDTDKNKTAFVTHCGVHRFTRMPFGLCNAPATFQRALDMILARVKWSTALIYLDDVIIYSRSTEDHIQHVEEILSLLKQAGVSLKLKKCHFFQSSVDYLGHIIYPGKLAVANKNIESIRKAIFPTTRTQLRSFLGMCNVYRRFVDKFAKIAGPLSDMLKKGEAEIFTLNEKQQEAFNKLRESLIQPPILTLPKEGGKFTLDVDACDYQIGACLLQEQSDGTLLPCGYYSRTLNTAERNYSTPEKECLAVVWAILLLRPYLEGVSFTVRSDQVALRWLLSFKDPSGRLARWRLRLAELDFVIHYRPGIKNNLADGCSRVPSQGSDRTECDDAIPCFIQTDLPTVIPIQEIYQAQLTDATCIKLREEINKGESKFFIHEEDECQLVCRLSAHPELKRIYIPEQLRDQIMHLAHYPTNAGHPGGRKMFYTLSQHFYWSTMVPDIYHYVKKCYQCTKENSDLVKRHKALKLFPADGPLEFIAIDILGPLTKTKAGNQYLLVISDRFSKLVRTIPLRTITTYTVAVAFAIIGLLFMEYLNYYYLIMELSSILNSFRHAARYSESNKRLQQLIIRRLTDKWKGLTELF